MFPPDMEYLALQLSTMLTGPGAKSNFYGMVNKVQTAPIDSARGKILKKMYVDNCKGKGEEDLPETVETITYIKTTAAGALLVDQLDDPNLQRTVRAVNKCDMAACFLIHSMNFGVNQFRGKKILDTVRVRRPANMKALVYMMQTYGLGSMSLGEKVRVIGGRHGQVVGRLEKPDGYVVRIDGKNHAFTHDQVVHTPTYALAPPCEVDAFGQTIHPIHTTLVFRVKGEPVAWEVDPTAAQYTFAPCVIKEAPDVSWERELPLRIGTRVVVDGIVSQPALNGQEGTVTSFKGGRYGVQIDGTTEPIALRRSTLIAPDIDTAILAGPGEIVPIDMVDYLQMLASLVFTYSASSEEGYEAVREPLARMARKVVADPSQMIQSFEEAYKEKRVRREGGGADPFSLFLM